MKRTLLTLIAALLLGGAAIAQNHWDAPDSHAKSSNTPIVASVTIDGEAVTPTADYRLGAFVNDSLRGIAAPHTDNNFWIQVFYNQGTSEDITFKLYDGTTEYASCAVTKATQEEGWGTPSEPVVLDFVTTQTQSIAMVQGWNWWGTSIELTNNNGLEQLQTGLGNTCIIIKSREDGNLEPVDLGGEIFWFGELTTLHNEQMYMIQTNAASNFTMSGSRASSSNHPITIKKGWNWIGYPCSQAIPINTAMSGFAASDGDQIKSRNGFADYLAVMDMWLGSFDNLEPEQGYMYLSNNDNNQTLVYQVGRQESTIINNDVTNHIYQPEIDNYAYNMTIIAVVELDNDELRSDNYEIAAFVGNECRGTIKLRYVEPLDRYIAFLLIFGDKEESLRFVLTDGVNTQWSDDCLIYSNNAAIGSLTDPAVLHFGTLGLNEDGQIFVNVYPNPSKDVFNIEGNGICKVEVINSYGQVVYSKEVKNDNQQINLNNYAIGTYLLRVVTHNGIVTKQLIKE